MLSVGESNNASGVRRSARGHRHLTFTVDKQWERSLRAAGILELQGQVHRHRDAERLQQNPTGYKRLAEQAASEAGYSCSNKVPCVDFANEC